MWKLSKDGCFSVNSSNFFVMDLVLTNQYFKKGGNWSGI